MAFYSTQDYLAAEARKSLMELRGITPPPRPGVVHPPAHERQRMQSLLDSIPETQPGPNAFAIQLAMRERQRTESRMEMMQERDRRREVDEHEVVDMREFFGERRRENASHSNQQSLRPGLDTNSAYQGALQRRRVTPPTAVHPALRECTPPTEVPPTLRGRSVSEASILARQSDRINNPPPSNCTNITEFMNAGMEESPKLKLKATPNPATVPTFRDVLEKTNPPVKHGRTESIGESVPVFRPTPKLPATRDFAQRPSTPADDLQKEASGSKLPTKTPKKSIFSKFKLSTNSRTANSTAVNELPADPASQVEEQVPVKAQAVLGESPRKPKGRVSLPVSPTKIPRSPSKRKNFFSRKNVEFTEPPRPSTALSEHQRPPNTLNTVVSDEPQTAISDPTHYSYQEKPKQSKCQFEEARARKNKDMQKNAMIVRSHSVNLRSLDAGIPPTPPAKNTPPHEKAAKEAKEVQQMHEAMKVSAYQCEHPAQNGDEKILGEAQLGNYGYRDAPTLVTKPSMYSMHASVVPDLMEASTIEEMNARVGALDLEGFSTPAENIRRSHIAAAVYSPSIYSTDWATKAGVANTGATPMLQGEEPRSSNTPSAHTKASSSNGTIPIFYPDLASDPFVGNRASKETSKCANDSPVNRGRTHLSPELTWHRRTHSRDPLDVESQMFAHQPINHDDLTSSYNSPSAFSHTSAMPSPLQYLPPTVYAPATKKSTKKVVQGETDVSQHTPYEKKVSKPTRGSGLGIQNGGASGSNSPDRSGDIFDSKPCLLASGRSSPTPQPNVKPLPYAGAVNVDPQKQPSALSDVPADKLYLVMEMLNKLHTRNGELIDMRDEMRASTARLDQRLSAVESQSRTTPLLTPSTLSQNGSDQQARSQANRIPTDVAHEFYRSAQRDELGGQGESKDDGGMGTEGGVSETIRALRETNRKLLEMVGGFANKIQALEEKIERGSG